MSDSGNAQRIVSIISPSNHSNADSLGDISPPHKRRRRRSYSSSPDDEQQQHHDHGHRHDNDEDDDDERRRRRRRRRRSDSSDSSSSSSRHHKRRRRSSGSPSSSSSSSRHRHHHHHHRSSSSSSSRHGSSSSGSSRGSRHHRSSSRDDHHYHHHHHSSYHDYHHGDRSYHRRSGGGRYYHHSSRSPSPSSARLSLDGRSHHPHSSSSSSGHHHHHVHLASSDTDSFSQTTTAAFDEVKAGDREKRTISVSRLPPTVHERDVEQFFSSVGKVRDVKLIRDRFTGKPKGFGYVEFYDQSSVLPACSLNGQMLNGFPIVIKTSEAEKNVSHGSQGHSQGITKLYVGNIPDSFDENDLKMLFGCFGYLASVEIHQQQQQQQHDDNTSSTSNHHRAISAVDRQSSKYGYVKFTKPENARKALLKINSLHFHGGLQLKVGLWNEAKAIEARESELELDSDKGGIGLTAQQRLQMMANFNMNTQQPQQQQMEENHHHQHPPVITNRPEVQHVVAPITAVASTTTSTNSSDDSNNASGLANSNDTFATRNIRLTNMFEPREMETNLGYDREIKADVEDECSNFGRVLFVFVDKYSMGHVYVKFENPEGARLAHRALNGRWFAGKQITSEYLSDVSFRAKTGYAN